MKEKNYLMIGVKIKTECYSRMGSLITYLRIVWKKDEGMYVIMIDGLIDDVVPLDKLDETLKELTEFGYELED